MRLVVLVILRLAGCWFNCFCGLCTCSYRVLVLVDGDAKASLCSALVCSIHLRWMFAVCLPPCLSIYKRAASLRRPNGAGGWWGWPGGPFLRGCPRVIWATRWDSFRTQQVLLPLRSMTFHPGAPSVVFFHDGQNGQSAFCPFQPYLFFCLLCLFPASSWNAPY